MNLRSYTEKAAAYAPGLFLVLATALGGLRSPLLWIVFGAVFLTWCLETGRRLGAAGREYGLLFFCWLAAAALFSSDAAFSLSVLARYAVFAALFFSAARGEEEGWTAAVLGLGLAASLVFVLQKAAGLSVQGFIGANPNYSAAFAAAAFPVALLRAADAAGRRRAVPVLACVLLAAGLVVSGSRGALAAAFLSAAAGLAVSGRRRALAAFLLAAAAAAALLPLSSIEGLLKFYDPKAFVRPRIWGAALKAAWAEPMLGWGPGLFERVFELFKFPYFDGVSFYGHNTLHAHSEVLNLAAEAGFPAALLFLAAAAAGILRGGKASLPLKLCALAVFLQGGVDIVFYSGAVSLLFWGTLGMISAGEPARPGGSWKLRALLAAGCMAGLIAGAALYAAPGLTKKVRGPYPEAGVARYELEALQKPKDPFPPAIAGDILYEAGDLRGAEAAYGRALALEPFFAGVRLDLARVYAASGRRDAACAQAAMAGKAAGMKTADDYETMLVWLDRAGLEKFKKDLCGKKKAGGATARGRKTR